MTEQDADGEVNLASPSAPGSSDSTRFAQDPRHGIGSCDRRGDGLGRDGPVFPSGYRRLRAITRSVEEPVGAGELGSTPLLRAQRVPPLGWARSTNR